AFAGGPPPSAKQRHAAKATNLVAVLVTCAPSHFFSFETGHMIERCSQSGLVSGQSPLAAHQPLGSSGERQFASCCAIEQIRGLGPPSNNLKNSPQEETA